MKSPVHKRLGSLLAMVLTSVSFAGASSTDQVVHIDAQKTGAAFAKGQPPLETDIYKIHASRREGPGMAEVHTRDTDIVYVLEGSAVIVTGGSVVGGKEIAAYEIRGARIDGGLTRTLSKGDVMVIPNGVPHWFREVTGPLLYHVVKTTSAEAAAVDDAPAATIDLATREGAALVKGQWRYSDTTIVDTEFKEPGVDGQPTGGPAQTYDYAPKAGAADFDDASWEIIDPTTLQQRRGHGRLSFNWYRVNVTIPQSIGTFDPTGATVELETVLDDYAEIWVDGELPRAVGQQGGSVVSGWNAPNRLVIGRNVTPGQRIQLAIFGMNGPLSGSPTNYIWVRTAKLHFGAGSPGPLAVTPQEVNVDVVRKDPAMDAIVGYNPKLYKLAEGFAFTEGPVWLSDERALLFSDPNRNTIYRYDSQGTLSVFRSASGYAGADIAEYKQPGSNGLALDPQGRLTINEHGNRRVSRLEPDARMTVLADRYDGKRLNSPNDLVYRSDGTLFFTDPPFGLPKANEDPRKELRANGVYAVKDGAIRLLTEELSGPNGIALSPDEKYLYVGNWDDTKKVVMRYEVNREGSLTNGHVFIDMTTAPGEDAIDGIKVDVQGNVYVSGPGGLWVISAAGVHLGTIVTPRHVHNMAWGDSDGKTLYLCARDRLYRMPLNIAGAPVTAHDTMSRER